MNHKELLDEVYQNRLESANYYSLMEDEGKQAIKDVTVLTDRQIELEKIEIEKRKLDLEEKKLKFEPWKTVAVPVGMFLLESAFTVGLMVAIHNFEKSESYTTTPGRALGDMFRRKLSK